MAFAGVEPRLVPVEGDRYHLEAAGAMACCDETPLPAFAMAV